MGNIKLSKTFKASSFKMFKLYANRFLSLSFFFPPKHAIKVLLSPDSYCGPYEKMLLKHLLYDYERQNRPVLNETEPLVLTFGITLQQIIDVVSPDYLEKIC